VRRLTPGQDDRSHGPPGAALQQRFNARLDRLAACLPAGGPLGVAVSGGSDSMALLTLAEGWARVRRSGLLALTVDHGLRQGSAREAAAVAAHCRARGIDHRTLSWQAGPATRTPARDRRAVQATARQARHALLAGALRAAGGKWLLMGHTGDDQIETFLMRARQGSGWYGLGGMDPVSVSPAWPEGRGVFLVRPLLGEWRDWLRHALEDSGVGWTDDPSNTDPRHERVRVRALVAARPGLRDRLARCVAGLAVLRQAERQALARALAGEVSVPGAGTLAWRRTPLPAAREARLLSILLQVAAGRAAMPDQAGVRALVAAMAEMAEGRGRTLAGARIAWDRAHVLVGRDPGCAAPPPDATDTVWDGRFCRRDRPALVPTRPVRLSSPVRMPKVLPPDPEAWEDLSAARLQALTASMKC